MNGWRATWVLLAACVVGAVLLFVFGDDTSPPPPNIVVLPNAHATTTTMTKPLLGVACRTRDGYPYRAQKCLETP